MLLVYMIDMNRIKKPYLCVINSPMIRIFHLNVVDHHKDFLEYFKLMVAIVLLVKQS